MAKQCTFESYRTDGEPLWCCPKKSTETVSTDVVDKVVAFWEEPGMTTGIWIIYTDLCDTHAKQAKEVYKNLT